MKSLHEAMIDPELLGKTFGGESFANWRVVAKAMDGLPLEPAELEVYTLLTGRAVAPTTATSELYFVKTRRAGGTLFEAGIGVHAALQDYRGKLGPGEVAMVALIASDRKQARQLMNYVKGLIHDSPIIAAEVTQETAEGIHFAHRTVIEVHVASFRSVRGYSLAAVLLDELAFYRSDLSANPDIELVRALRPALANLGGRLFGFSSPHARRGHLWDMYRRHYGKASRVLVLQCTDPLLLNPTLSAQMIEAAQEEDPLAARSEWGGQFREDISQYLDDDLIDKAVRVGRRALPATGREHYVAFCDPSGGRHDAMTLGIAHREAGDRLVLDKLVIQTPPFDPADAVEKLCETLSSYGLSRVTGDRYAAEWCTSAFAKYGVAYEASDLDKSAIYVECLPLFTQNLVELLDVPQLATELRLLERRPRPGGKGDLIDHPPRATDDAANAACGALLAASKAPQIRASNLSQQFAQCEYDPYSRL